MKNFFDTTNSTGDKVSPLFQSIGLKMGLALIIY